MKNKKFCVANWKMNMNHDDSIEFLKRFRTYDLINNNTEIVICPSYTSLFSCMNFQGLPNVSWGAQDVSCKIDGSNTGEISIEMIENLGSSYVIVGHSERRASFNETNEHVAQKFINIYNSNLTPILCVGEEYEDRKNETFASTLKKQINSALSKISNFNKDIVLAYEPVWAIGSGASADIKTISETHALIKNIINKYTLKNCNIWLLYGGSVNEDNSSEIISLEDVDGFLIGGASLSPSKFYNIYRSMGGI